MQKEKGQKKKRDKQHPTLFTVINPHEDESESSEQKLEEPEPLVYLVALDGSGFFFLILLILLILLIFFPELFC